MSEAMEIVSGPAQRTPLAVIDSSAILTLEGHHHAGGELQRLPTVVDVSETFRPPFSGSEH